MNALVQEVEKRLKNEFGEHLQMEFKDEKWDGKHFYLIITSEKFEWLSRIERSRKVHHLLDDLLKDDSIHALRTKLQTPGE